MGRFGLGERGRFRARPDPSNCRRAFFIMRKAVVAIRRRNTLSAVPLAIQKPAGQANNPAYRRLRRFFRLGKRDVRSGPASHDSGGIRPESWDVIAMGQTIFDPA